MLKECRLCHESFHVKCSCYACTGHDIFNFKSVSSNYLLLNFCAFFFFVSTHWNQNRIHEPFYSSISFQLIRAIMLMANLKTSFVMTLLITGHFIVLFTANYFGQQVTDHSNEIFTTA